MRKESSTYDRKGQECRQDNSRQFSKNWIVLLIAIELDSVWSSVKDSKMDSATAHG